MQEIFTIIENGLPVGFFVEERHRDEAFDDYFKKVKDRFGIKGSMKVR